MPLDESRALVLTARGDLIFDNEDSKMGVVLIKNLSVLTIAGIIEYIHSLGLRRVIDLSDTIFENPAVIGTMLNITVPRQTYDVVTMLLVNGTVQILPWRQTGIPPVVLIWQIGLPTIMLGIHPEEVNAQPVVNSTYSLVLNTQTRQLERIWLREQSLGAHHQIIAQLVGGNEANQIIDLVHTELGLWRLVDVTDLLFQYYSVQSNQIYGAKTHDLVTIHIMPSGWKAIHWRPSGGREIPMILITDDRIPGANTLLEQRVDHQLIIEPAVAMQEVVM